MVFSNSSDDNLHKGQPLQNNQANSVILVVDTTADENDGSASIGSGLSLRDAITIANNNSSQQYVIKLRSGSTYQLSHINNTFSGDKSLNTKGKIIIETDGNAPASIVNNSTQSGGYWPYWLFEDNNIFVNDSTDGVTLNNLLISNRAGRGLRNNGILSLAKSTISGNHATVGGGIFNYLNGSLYMIDNTIENNRSGAQGAGIANFGRMEIINSIVANNSSFDERSVSGGGIYNHVQGLLSISNSLITRNSSSLGAGITNYGSLALKKSKINHNNAGVGGGGIFHEAGTLTLDTVIIAENQGGGGGGGINVSSGKATITNSILSNNKAGLGGAVINYNGGELILSKSSIVQNKAFDGGGLHNNGLLSAGESIIAGNEATYNGGGILNVRPGVLDLSYSSVINNIAKESGGGLDNMEGRTTLLGNTIVGNSSRVGGGISNSGQLTATYNSISGNSAEYNGGGIHNVTGDLVLSNNLVTANISKRLGGGLFNIGAKWSSNSNIKANTANEKWGINPDSGMSTVYLPPILKLDPKYPDVYDNGTYTSLPASPDPPPLLNPLPPTNPPKRLSPIFILPGIGAVFPASLSVNKEWTLRRGFDPDRMVPDPFYRTYDDLIKTLENVGYTQEEDLFIIPYDWRLPPGPIDGNVDGNLAGLTADSITSGSYRYSVDYLGEAMAKASLLWRMKYGEELGKVDIIGHSTGAIVARSYIQSDAYNGRLSYGSALPKVNNLITFGAPQRGATKVLNPINNNWNISAFYRLIFRNIAYLAYRDVLSGKTIYGPADPTWKTGDITRKIIVGSKGDFTGDYDEDGIENQAGDDLNRDGLVNELDAKVFFLHKYNPTNKALLSTMLSDEELPRTSASLNIIQPDARNQFLPDLNNGLDLNSSEISSPSPTAWVSKIGRLTALYGSNIKTPTSIVRHVGPAYFGDTEEISSPYESGPRLKSTIYSMGDVLFGRPANPEEVWYEDIFSTSGDGTVPLESLEGLFKQFPADNIVLKPFTFGSNTQGSIEHSGLLSNRDALRSVLETLGVDFREQDISTSLYKGEASNLPYLDKLFKWLIAADTNNQYIETFIAGADAAYEINPSFTSAFSFGSSNLWVFDQADPSTLSNLAPKVLLSGKGENYELLLSGVFQNHEFEISDSGFLGLGETKDILLVFPSVNGDSASVYKGKSVSIDVMANDFPSTGNIELYEFQNRSKNGGIVAFGDNGTLGRADDYLIYQAPSDFSGVDYFYYKTFSNGVKSLAKVLVEVIEEPLPVLPAITLETSYSSSVNEDGMSNLVFIFTRTQSNATSLTINYTVGGNASLGSDYSGIAATPAIKTFSFAAGEGTASVLLDLIADKDFEPDETISLTLVPGTGYTLGTTLAVTATILNDDFPPPVNHGAANFSITGTPAVGNTLTASLSTADPDGNGSGGFSYSWQSSPDGTNWSPVGTNSPSYLVASADQGKQLRLVVNYTDAEQFPEIVTTAIGSVPLLPTPPPPPPPAPSNDGQAVFAIAGTPAVGNTLTASLSTADPDGNGSGGFSYSWQSSPDGNTWSPVGTNSPSYLVASTDQGKQLRLVVTYTDAEEFPETVTTTIGSVPLLPTPPPPPPPPAPEPLTLSISSSAANQAEGSIGSTPYAFTVLRTGNLSQQSNVSWQVLGSGSSPADAMDFAGGALPSGTLTFQPGVESLPITVNVLGDASLEADEGFDVVLSSPVNARLVSQGSSISSVIDNDDSPGATYSFSATPDPVYEGNLLAIGVNTTNVSPGTQLFWRFGGAGITASDFSDGLLSGDVSIGIDGRAGFTRRLAADAEVDPDETLELRFFADSSYTQQIGSTTTIALKEPNVGVATDGNDLLTGTPSTNTISGIPIGSSLRGRGSLDHLTGNRSADTFVLGDALGVYYDDGTPGLGTSDLAVITDLIPGDRIQLFGTPSDYRLLSGRYSQVRGVRIDALNGTSGGGPEAIGFVQGATLPTLNLSDPAQFLYV